MLPSMATCPLCGSRVDVTYGEIEEQYHPGYLVATDRMPTRVRPATFAACNGCELCFELTLGMSEAQVDAATRHAIEELS